MDNVRVELHDLDLELKCSLFGVCCVVTLLAFCYVILRLSTSPVRMPWNEFSVILLSCAQLLCGIVFYFGSQHPFLQIVKKAIKVIQAEIISWSCIRILLESKRQRATRTRVIFHLVTFMIGAVLLYSFIYVTDTSVLFNAKIGIFMSAMWCIMSMSVTYVADKIRKKLDVSNLVLSEAVQSVDTAQSVPGRLENLDPETGDLVESYSETKYQQLLMLVVVEAVTATGTLIWDLVMYYSIQQSVMDKSLELHLPILKEVLYILSNTMLILIPNWTVFYVLYWVQRHNYTRVSSKWDVNMNTMSFSEPDRRPFV
ncbi:putative integral membrane protein [Babesia bovis T2Bo]|uniref:Uncharacterized protein n=1 Tax=Babesia bovis TaxID=5865 RepID=A7AMD6_BABBO|nr:putative integral membrane protein [Babesia bovis T2Bo]EDO07720.1 putative integral membrane protein [Babesia bovis T2Bo]|eukprot:XP_001611288.1 hypothetical protein [Babesia bovis T2Bo]